MKMLPESERPYERCLGEGPAVLSDAELLAVIIHSGTQKQSSLAIGEELLRRFGREGGLTFLTDVSKEELMSLPGIGEVKAASLLCVGELSRRIVRTARKKSVILNSPKSIADYFMEEMRHLPREELRLAMFDTKQRLIGTRILSVGTVNSSLASQREIFSAALKANATAIVVLHNHPSGDPAPSREDLRTTKTLADSGNIVGIPLIDHIIIGDLRYISMKAEGLL